MNLIYKTFKHIKTILIHKYWVAHYCFQLGLYWRGLVHDLSKFHPVEFLESIKYYSGTDSPINLCKKDKGYSLAWLHHKGRNTHHYEYWIDYLDSGGKPIRMPINDIKELVCDWIAAGKTYMGENFTFSKEAKYVVNKLMSANIHSDTTMSIVAVFTKLMISKNPEADFKEIVESNVDSETR